MLIASFGCLNNTVDYAQSVNISLNIWKIDIDSNYDTPDQKLAETIVENSA